MKENYTHIAVLSDRSGSMETIRTDVEGGFNTFLNDQKKLPGKCTVSLAQFNSVYELEYSFKDINDVPKFKVIPGGSTALNDSLAKMIIDTGKALADMKEEERPSKVIFIVSTDGYENASREYTGAMVKELVEEQTNTYKWDFIYLGANQDAVLTGSNMGFSKGSSMTYAATKKGVLNLYSSLSSSVAYSRATGSSVNFSDEDRSKSMAS